MATTTKSKNGSSALETIEQITAPVPAELVPTAPAAVAKAPAKSAARGKVEVTGIVIPEIKIHHLTVTLIGDSPLIVHRWSEKAKKEMLATQMKQAKEARGAKNPEEDYEGSIYYMPGYNKDSEEPRYGFPSVAFKAAAVGACRFADGIPMTVARGAFHVVGELTEILGEPQMREDMVRVANGAADIRFRAEFVDWRAVVEIDFNPMVLSSEQITNLLNLAGFGQGIGEWRPERNGPYGRFHVARTDEL